MNIAPLSPRITFVNKSFTQDLGADTTYFGVEKGKTSRLELGGSLNAYWLSNLFKNVEFEQRLGLYTNYLDTPKNIDVDYQASLNMNVNKNISANVIVHLLYDDNAVKDLQVRQVFGIGVQMAL